MLGVGWLYLLNPMTPIVLTFQRVLYPHLVVQSTNYPKTPVPRYLPVLPTWSPATYAGLDCLILVGRCGAPRRRRVRCSAGSRATSPRSCDGRPRRRGPAGLEALPPLPRAARLGEGPAHPPRPVDLLGPRRAEGRGLHGRRGRDGRASSGATARASRRCSSASAACCSRRRARCSCEARSPACSSSGAGFQIELSGRDNIYLNGAMLGLSQEGRRPGLRRHRRVLRARASSSTPR